jgi:chaperonin GroEL
VLKVVAIRAPGFGANMLESLEDLAVVIGATIVSEEQGMKIEGTTIEQLGTCKKLTIEKNSTVIVGGAGSKARIDARTEEIRHLLGITESNYEREKLQERLGKIQGAVAVISVGGASDNDVSEAKDLFEDAVSATRAAIEEGIVPGGGVALVRGAKALQALTTKNLEQRTGIDIVAKAIAQPARQIAENAGQSGDVVVARISAEQKPSFGYDARSDAYVDMFEKGIVDPTKVVRLALVNAASVASSMTSVDCLVVEEAEFKAPPPPPPAPRQAPADMDDL